MDKPKYLLIINDYTTSSHGKYNGCIFKVTSWNALNDLPRIIVEDEEITLISTIWQAYEPTELEIAVLF